MSYDIKIGMQKAEKETIQILLTSSLLGDPRLALVLALANGAYRLVANYLKHK